MKLVRLMLLASCALAWQTAAQAQTWDTSGNSLLNGTYYFREVIYILGDQNGDLNEALALYGNITFNGSGTYSINGTLMDSNVGRPQSGTLTGTYSISASGFGFLSNPLSQGDLIYGLVSKQGVFVGSSTEGGFNDMMIATPVSSPLATNGSFKGNYWIADMDLSSGSPLGAISSLFQMNPDGAGNLGTVALTGYIGYGTTLFSQTAQGVKYNFSNGAASVQFPNNTSTTALISGQKYLYISPDGEFVFGGSPVGWDMFVGIRAPTDSPTMSGLYYQAGIDEDNSHLQQFGYGDLDTYYGSFSANAGSIVGHRRLADVLLGNTDLTYRDSYTMKSDGTYSNGLARYVVSTGGSIVIGSGTGRTLGLQVALAAPSPTGSGVFLSPQGVVNAASSAPFTAGVSPGELITLYGSNLAPDTFFADGVPFPNNLGGVQVMVNGLPAPIYYATPGQISAIIPYAVTTATAQIQVINNGTPSNTVSEFVNLTSPGVFTVPAGGLGYAAALHPDYSLVTTANPAKLGETISVYVTGLGAVNPLVQDGAAGPTDTLRTTNNTILAYVGGIQSTVTYSGLAPGLAGLYQVNFTLPTSNITAGDNLMSIVGPDFATSEALIPVSTTATAAAPALVEGPGAVPRVRRPDVKGTRRKIQ